MVVAEDAVGTVVVSVKAWWSPPQRRSQDTCARSELIWSSAWQIIALFPQVGPGFIIPP
jgi:hypothetical protein